MLSKVYKCKFLLAMLLVPFLATAQPAGWETTETLFTHVLSIPASVTPEIDGVPISTGDWVGVFYNDGGGFEMRRKHSIHRRCCKCFFCFWK